MSSESSPRQEFWNTRYSGSEYVYGTEPNEYFKEKIDNLEPGFLLLPAEGEGRNAVYAARSGWTVEAYDFSEMAQNKALQLAHSNGMEIQYQLTDHRFVQYSSHQFSAIALIFVHLPSEFRGSFHKRVISWLQPGGTIILEAYSKNQIQYKSGGPQNPDLLYDLKVLERDFADLESTQFTELVRPLREGQCHRGFGSVVRLLGKK